MIDSIGLDEPLRPDLRQPARRLTAIGRVLVVGAVLALVAWASLGYPELLVVAVAATVLLLLAVVWTARQPPMEIERRVRLGTVVAGDPIRATARVRNLGSRRSRPVRLRDPLGAVMADLTIPSIDPGDELTVTYEIPTKRRGRYFLGPASVHRSDPVGVLVAARGLADPLLVVVRPRIHVIELPPSGRDRDLEGPLRDRAEGASSFRALREYVPGDDRRQIHWRSSARLGTLLVRQLVDPSEQRTTVFVDCRPWVLTEDEFEEAVEVAASVVAAATMSGHRICLFGDGGPTGEVRGEELLDRLANIEQRLAAPPVVDLARSPVRGMLVMVTGGDGPNTASVLAATPHADRIVYLSVRTGDVASVTSPLPRTTVISGPSARDVLTTWRRGRVE